jgi:hypothetical protein
MKKSRLVTLVISGALLAGCEDRPVNRDWQYGDQPLTNNTYSPGHGYWHAPYHDWFPYPYNSYYPGQGYYHGGNYSMTPHASDIISSRPSSSSSSRGTSGSISRGGFGRGVSGLS